MNTSFAPMEGVTGYIYRNIHALYFGGAVKYYSPFIAPDGNGTFKSSCLKDILPENNEGITLIPQLLVNSSTAFISASRKIADLGYGEVNLNLGCPSGTVVAKHKGSGMLGDLVSLDNMLADIFALSPVKVSIKTRMGLNCVDEFGAILEIYNKYPITELIIHARDRAGMYRSTPDTEAFCSAFFKSLVPVTYNGNIFKKEDAALLNERLTELESIMVGRGAVANPALTRVLKGGKALEKEELRAFHDELVSETLASGLSEQFTAARMKELWYYMSSLFPEGNKALKALNKSRSLSDYTAAVGLMFSAGGFDGSAGFDR